MAAVRSTIVCPACGHRESEIMPEDACQYFYQCKGVPRAAEAEKGGLLRLLLVRRCEVSIRTTKRWMLSSTSTARFTVCGLRLAHCRWRDIFAFYKAYPQKRITAEIELIDKRNVQTYVDRAVVRPLTIPSGAQSPLLRPLGISFSPSCCD